MKLPVKDEPLEKVILSFYGNISQIANHYGTNRRSIYERIKKSPYLQSVLEEAREFQLDFVESKLQQEINDGNIVAILFYLKCMGKKRGFIEKVSEDINITLNEPVKINYIEPKQIGE
jgi:hypothetical protein